MKLVADADIKTFLGISVATHDTLLGLINDKVSARIESYCDRTFTQTAGAIEYPIGGSKILELKIIPIASVASIYEDTDREFAAASLVDSDDYWVDTNVVWRTDGAKWSDAPGAIKVTYTGGYVASSGVLPVPDDLKGAALLQAAFIFQRRNQLGLSGVTSAEGSVQMLQQIQLLPEVKEILSRYRRAML